MTLIAASVITKSGKALVTRSFVGSFVPQMTKVRLEELLDAFPRLVSLDRTQRQHTFAETDSVRYVYQPLDNIYMVLVTTKASNILEDIETLRLFSRVIPEYCRSNDESEILNHSFELIFAFDEIVALGYRESVTLAKIRTFTEMDSHEERVANQIKIAQERAAKTIMYNKAKELKKKRDEALKMAKPFSKVEALLVSAGANRTNAIRSSVNQMVYIPKAVGCGKALKLGTKDTNDEKFFNQLQNEGQNMVDMQFKFSISSESLKKEELDEDMEWVWK